MVSIINKYLDITTKNRNESVRGKNFRSFSYIGIFGFPRFFFKILRGIFVEFRFDTFFAVP